MNKSQELQLGKVKRLSGCGHKDEVRGAVLDQIMEAVTSGLMGKNRKFIRGVTLPGINFGFERLLGGMCERRGIQLECDGAENDHGIFCNSVLRKPEFCTLSETGFEKLLTHNVIAGRYGTGVDFKPRSSTENDRIYDFGWADFCQLAMPDKMRSIVNFLKYCHGLKKDLLFHATFAVSQGGNHMDGLCGYVYGKPQPEIIMDTFKTMLKKAGVPFKFVLDFRYTGGESYSFPMFTMGIAIGKCMKVTPLRKVINHTVNPSYHLGLRKISAQAKLDGVRRKNSKPVDPAKALHLVGNDTSKASRKADQEAVRVMKSRVKAMGIAMWPKYRQPSELNAYVHRIMKHAFSDLTLKRVAGILAHVVHKDSFAGAAAKRRKAA